MFPLWQMQARHRFTDRNHGDLAAEAAGAAARRQAVAAMPWTWLHQVHGAGVVTVRAPGQGAGMEADAAVTASPGAAVAVQVADCAPVVLRADDGVGVVHAGWRGLVAGVVPAAVDALRTIAAGPVRAVVGPCVGVECYEFGPSDLDDVAAELGDAVRGRTSEGAPALDLGAGVVSALGRAGVRETSVVGTCTACSPRHWSVRGGDGEQRQAVVAWLEP